MDHNQQRVLPGYFQTEEFQALFTLVLERLRTTHNREKLKRFGAALINSGSTEFLNEDRENLVRVLGEVNMSELRMLNDEHLRNPPPPLTPATYDSGSLTRLSHLAALGLVHERRISGFDGGPAVGRDRIYVLSEFGASFLRFVSNDG
jgi:hypothetical protein